jgi:phosphate starvation-inducible PhoH-like protein
LEVTIDIASQEEAMTLFGLGDRNLKLIRDALPVNVSAREGTLRVAGEQKPVGDAVGILNELIELYRRGSEIPRDYVDARLRDLGENGDGGVRANFRPGTLRTEMDPIDRIARTEGQARYLQSVLDNDVAFCVGPAGTGKTFLAVRTGLGYLKGGDIRKIILCRPAVEAGEKLGFLPGDFQAKINPYLRPLYDALNEILDFDQVTRYIERDIIEVIPLAYMRGRTFNQSFIILDEGQNTSVSQMKMFLTRMGMMSKIVVTGDITQTDLPPGTQSGLVHARKLLSRVKGIGWMELQAEDIVRHHLVKKIVAIYDKDERRRLGTKNARAADAANDSASPALPLSNDGANASSSDKADTAGVSEKNG